MTNIQRQRGAFLVMMSLLIVVLIGIAALALDFGRVVALRAEMQNAVDAAALAGAVELDGKPGAQLRARSAARNAVIHDSRYARVAELLGDASLPDAAFGYFCVIGAKYDISDDDAPNYCAGAQTAPRTWPATGDEDTHYLRVHLDPALVADHFRVDLIFLPVLRLFDIDPATFVALNATATAGRHSYECNYPPMMLCDPFEGTGTTFKEAMAAGQAIELREQGGNSFWSPGLFGFLEPLGGGPGAGDLALYLADEGLQGCTPPIITTKPGENMGKTTAAINTRFDIYSNPAPFNKPDAPANWPPAPNVMGYPNDTGYQMIGGATNNRFGRGDWDFDAYWLANHAGVVKPNAWSNFNRPKRADVYAWEIANNAIPVSGRPNPAHLYTGDYPPPRSIPERRELHVAVVSCTTLNIKGKTSGLIYEPDGFARMFLYRPANGPPNAVIFAEYLGWSLEQDAHYHVDIQLYQ